MATVVCVLMAGQGWAMHITRSVGLAAFSNDGKSVLLHVSEHGPEGGGKQAYRLLSVEHRDGADEFVESSDFSPGNGSTPQVITRPACEAMADRLKARLEKAGMSRMKVDRARCDGKNNSGAVQRVGEDDKSHFRAEGKELALNGFRLAVSAGKLVLKGPGGSAQLMDLKPEELDNVTAVMGPHGALLLLFQRGAYGDQELAGAFHSASGNARDFQRLPW
jgi:hypothetical protein